MDPSQAVDCSSLPFLMDPSFEDNVLEGFLENMNSVASVQEAAFSTRKNGVCIPQQRYKRGARGPLDHQGLILFFLEDGSYFSVNAALAEQYNGLIHRDVPALCEVGDTVMLRFEWPGYPPQHYQVRSIDWCASPNKISQSKLATEVAKVVDKFVREMESVTITPEEAQWRVGQNGIQVKDLRLAALEQVTKGSWQVRLFYKPTN